jgi:gliding motility-associated-like protein
MSTNILLKSVFIFLVIYFGIAPQGNSAHLIGADMTFECLSQGQYRITFIVYRDCASDGAGFDSQAGQIPGKISIFGENGNRYLGMRDLQPPTVERINIEPDNPCQIVPPNLCVEQGKYEFNINLPISDESYFIVYQRCCRNNTINNIVSPHSTGATYFVEITPLAQSQCIDSPTFDEFPPVLICNNSPFEFNHSASDNTPGTQLVYSFYAPFTGGGLAGSRPDDEWEDAFSLVGVAPQPTSRPPYAPVSFIPPLFTTNTPLSGNPAVGINSSTGIINGQPNIQGQFVVGVQVEQFLNGQLISTVRRDFQFNVSNCESLIDAAVRADEITSNDIFVINSCGNLVVEFADRSTVIQGGRIEGYEWSFYVDSDTILRSGANPTLEFPREDSFLGRFVVNPNADLCSDTAYFQVNIFPSLSADFEFEYDTCAPGSVDFIDASITGGSNTILEWEWIFNSEGEGTGANTSHIFDESGLKEVSLEVTDDNDCSNIITRQLRYFPLPEIIVIEPQKFIGCAPEDIQFSNLSEYLSEDYMVTWDFGDGSTVDAISPVHQYTEPGIYDILIRVVSPFGCETQQLFPGFIKILEGPVAGFNVQPEVLNSFDQEVYVTDESTGGNGLQYNLNDEAQFFIPDLFYEFRDTGSVFIEQIVFKDNGCTDTLRKQLDVEPIATFFLPNAFTPNGDGLNDTYKGKGVTDFIGGFTMRIYSRWGELVFETTDPGEGWNGRKFNTGSDLPSGVYVCVVEFTEARGKSQVLKEFATLIR